MPTWNIDTSDPTYQTVLTRLQAFRSWFRSNYGPWIRRLPRERLAQWVQIDPLLAEVLSLYREIDREMERILDQ